MPEHARVADTRTPQAAKPGYGAKRAGAKAVKKMERESVEYKLSPADATTFRALSARANYLSQDRADIGFSPKEVCREIVIPNRNSQGKLKRVCRLLAGKPRLVHQYNWGTGSKLTRLPRFFVDTDFAGCKETRRSTSGGFVFSTDPTFANGRQHKRPPPSHQERPSCMGSMQASPKRSACNRSLRTVDFSTRLKSIEMRLPHLVCAGAEA